jgi:hypothetical protein
LKRLRKFRVGNGKNLELKLACYSCGRDFHWECVEPKEDGKCCCTKDNTPIFTETKKAVTVSAGRKEAARDYELDREAPCEWAGKANCGGGLKPIVGCITGLQEARHHGPIKDTTRNESGNVHRICTSCHNYWHRGNDEIYDEAIYATLPHNPRDATHAELLTRGK